MTIELDLDDADHDLLRILCLRFQKTEQDVLRAVLREWRTSTPQERIEQGLARTAERNKWERDRWPAWSDGYRTGWNHFQTRKKDCLPYRERYP